MPETETIYKVAPHVWRLHGMNHGDTFRASENPAVDVEPELAAGRILVHREADKPETEAGQSPAAEAGGQPGSSASATSEPAATKAPRAKKDQAATAPAKG